MQSPRLYSLHFDSRLNNSAAGVPAKLHQRDGGHDVGKDTCSPRCRSAGDAGSPWKIGAGPWGSGPGSESARGAHAASSGRPSNAYPPSPALVCALVPEGIEHAAAVGCGQLLAGL